MHSHAEPPHVVVVDGLEDVKEVRKDLDRHQSLLPERNLLVCVSSAQSLGRATVLETLRHSYVEAYGVSRELFRLAEDVSSLFTDALARAGGVREVIRALECLKV